MSNKTIRDQDKIVFARVAREEKLWILVRGTNHHSLQYVGRSGYAPKPIHCKAKTAKMGPFAGLVVDPNLATSAFPAGDKAFEVWREHDPRLHGDYSHLYAVEPGGLVKFDGKYLYGDYDLKGVVLPGQEQRNLALVTTYLGEHARFGPRDRLVMEKVNAALGVPMVQHGSAETFEGHDPDDSIFIFGPDSEYHEAHTLREIELWYSTKFSNRSTLDKNAPGGVPAGMTPGIRGVFSSNGSFRPVSGKKR